MRMLPNEEIIGAVSCKKDTNSNIILASRKGVIKQVSIKSIRACERGSMGVMALDLTNSKKSKDQVIDICIASGVLGMITNNGRYKRVNTDKQKNKGEDLSIINDLKEKEELTDLMPLQIIA